MRRTQISLEDWQYENLKTISQEKGKSLSAVIREMVTTGIEENSPRATLDSICALGEDPTGYGKDHNKLLYGTGKGLMVERIFISSKKGFKMLF